MHISRRGFTLIELLVAIAIIAILSVVVILTLNPAELLRQSRDSNRISDMSSLTSALGIFSGRPIFGLARRGEYGLCFYFGSNGSH